METNPVLPVEIEHAGRVHQQLLDARAHVDRLASRLREIEETIGLGPTIVTDVEAAEALLHGGCGAGDRVELELVGSGDVWPIGIHRRTGTVIKDGQTEYSVLVALDECIGDTEVVNASVTSVRARLER